MKILFLSNFYPPASRGGYEEWCREVLDLLRARGHDVRVLTSRHGALTLSAPDPEWVDRSLHLEMELNTWQNAYRFFTSRAAREAENLACLREALKGFAPDAALVWGMWNLHRSLPALLEEKLSGRVVYYMGDYWPSLPNQFEYYWEEPARSPITGFPKSVLRPFARRILEKEERPALQLQHVIYPTVFMRDEFKRLGLTRNGGRVVYGAVDTELYLRANSGHASRPYTSLLYVGRLVHQKGVHTVVEGLDYLIHTLGVFNVKLNIVGSGDADYEARLQKLVRDGKLEPFVNFLPNQPREVLPAIYHEADIFIFSSLWAEPFGRVIVEAMASGLPIIGTRVGGAAELLQDGENALVVLPDDPVSLAHQVKRLVDQPELGQKLGAQARITARSHFDIQRMTDGIEACLMERTAA